MSDKKHWTRVFSAHVCILMYTKIYQFKLSVRDDIYDACKTAKIKITAQEVLLSARYGGSTHESLLNESSRSCTLEFRVCVCVCVILPVEIAQGLFRLNLKVKFICSKCR
jgi:hypothetical protein